MKRKPRRAHPAVDPALNAALALHRAGRLADAKLAYEHVLRANPDCAEALYLLGILVYRIGNPDNAIALIRRAIALRPGFTEAQNDLGNILLETGKLEAAAVVFRKLLRLRPQHADAYNNLGVILKNQGNHEEAVRAYKKAIQLNPKNAGQHFNLGNTFKELERYDEAVAAYRRVIELEPAHTDAYQHLSATLRRTGKLRESRTVFRHWLTFDPENPIAQHMLIACSNGEPPPRASDAYVRQVFDRFANTFDNELKTLGYQGPTLLTAAITNALIPADRSLEVLDAGCGTGLCGQPLRRYSRRLVGVDLSPAMLDRARRLNVYDELVAAELTTYLNGVSGAFDLIASADTMSYFGVLEPMIAAMTGALRDGGHVVFTCEEYTGQDPERGYHLGHHGRYRHTRKYLKQCLADAGLTTCGFSTAVLRQEAGKPVEAFVVQARKDVAR